jgi:hypothetical protein
MRRSTSLLAVAGLLAWATGCESDQKKGDETKTAASGEGTGATGKTPEGGEKPAAEGDAAKLAEDIGVEPGGIEPDKDEGGAAVLSAMTGTVEIRRVGVETWEAAAADAELQPGDQVRTGDQSTATVALADETAIEVAEESAVAIGSREATADPASSAGVLYGVARFTASPRAEGEGPFMVYTPAGIIATKGTVYSVGVVASGQTRVGVEEGEVEVAGAAKLDAPVSVPSGKVVVLEPAGAVGTVEATGTVDFGTWRDEAEAKVDADAAAKFHAERAAALEAELKVTYAELEAQAQATAEAEAKAQAAADANDAAAYEATAPEIGAGVDASFALSLKLQFLTNALLAHAFVVDALYVRHPSVVAIVEPVRPQLAASILWQKKFHAVAHIHLLPLRPIFYVHHPVGRVHAKFVAYAIPPFFAKVNLRYKVPDVRGRVKVVYVPPAVKYKAGFKKAIWIGAPKANWHASLKARIRPAPFKVAWYVRPAAPKAKVVFGAKASGSLKSVFVVVPPRPRADAMIRFKGGIGVRDMGAGAGAGVKAGMTAPGIKVKETVGGGAAAGIKVKGGVDTAVSGKAVEAHDAKLKVGGAVGGAVGGVKAGVGELKTGAGVKAGVGLKAGAGVKAGTVKVKEEKKEEPKGDAKAKGDVKGSIKVKGGIKLGN